jgi:hypothetical protein
MGIDVQPPSGQSNSNPQADRFGLGPDAGLYLIGVIAVLAFISMLAVFFWVASRKNSAPVAVLPTSTPWIGTEDQVVLLPIVSGMSTGEDQADLTQGAESPAATTPLPTADFIVTSQAASALVTPPASANTPLQTPNATSAGQDNRTPSGSGAGQIPAPTSTTNNAQTQTATATFTNQTPTTTPTGELTTLFIRNDRGCVDPRTNDLYIFGEIVNNSSVSVDILNWDVSIYDGSQEIQTDNIFLDIPNSYTVFANNSIPFALLTTLDRSTFTEYDISLDYAAAPHSPRSDLSIVEYTATSGAGITEVLGTWSHTEVANPPEIVWIIATARDAQGKLTNLQYQHYTNASIIDPRLPAGHHNFRQLYLEDNPCGGGSIAVSILGE